MGWLPSGRCGVFACDIVSFTSPGRVDHVQRHLRAELYRRLRAAFDESGVPFDDCYREDRGDGALVAVPPRVAVRRLLSPLAEQLNAEFRRQNEVASEPARIRLRVAVHAGEVQHDGEGIAGTAVNHAFRLLEAPAFKQRIAETGARLAVIVSQQMYEEVVQQAMGLVDPAEFERVEVEVKETRTAGWVRLLGARPAAEAGAGQVAVPGGDAVPAEEPAAGPVAGRRAEVRFGAPAGPELSRRELMGLVELLLDVPTMANERGRDLVVGALRDDIARMVSRQREARLDTYCILRTCADHRDGVWELLAVLRGLEGPSAPLLRVERAIARLLG